MNVRIVPMDASHLDALAQIEQECFFAALEPLHAGRGAL